MPKMVTLIPNPAFSPKADQKLAFAEVTKKGQIVVDYPTALENVKLSGGMYAFKQEDEASAAAAPRELEDMNTDELKLLMLTTGVTPQKQMTRAEVIKSIRIKLSEIDIVDDE